MEEDFQNYLKRKLGVSALIKCGTHACNIALDGFT